MAKLFHVEKDVKILIGEVVTNHSMSIDDMLNALDIDMNQFADEQGWDGWDYDYLTIEME